MRSRQSLWQLVEHDLVRHETLPIEVTRMSFANKVILITGASSGIGAHAAVTLAKKGASVVLVDLNAERLKEVHEQIKSNGCHDPLTIVADVTTDAERIIRETIEHFGKLNVLINNAGVFLRGNIMNTDMADFDRVMNVNVRGAVQMIKSAVPHLEKTKGNILNVSSISGIRMRRDSYVYGISKAALNHLTKSCALDLAPNGIRVNAINPACVRTTLYENNEGITSEQADQFFEKFKKTYPAGRAGEVTDTTSAIEFLISDSASFFTGVLFTVDGGAILAGQ